MPSGPGLRNLRPRLPLRPGPAGEIKIAAVRPRRLWPVFLAVLVLVVAISAGWWWRAAGSASVPVAQRQGEKHALGLFTSLPILWSEAPSISDMLATPAPPHWARGVLEERYRLTALDTVTPPDRLRQLLIAQPRPLMPQENVALDAWVRGGGRVLLFADPMLTWDSAFAIGDKRRPQDLVLLSPILARWGLELRFDENQPAGEREMAGMPVNLPGSLARTGQGHEANCSIMDEGLIAECIVGKGRATVVADAALLEPGGDETARAVALDALMDRAFAD